MEEGEERVSLLTWIRPLLIATVSFWCQAITTEERLVPALTVIADHYKIPNDIAGATLMAAGASSPELFSSFLSLFVTHSSLGLGTIVGSEIFNQLVICAGAVYASKTGKLQLDRAIVLREVGFYALSILLLYLALQDIRPVENDDQDHIFISFGAACLVFCGYIGYVVVCANMEAVVAFFSNLFERVHGNVATATETHYELASKHSDLEGDSEPLIEQVPQMLIIEEGLGNQDDQDVTHRSKAIHDQNLEPEESTKMHDDSQDENACHVSLIKFPDGESDFVVICYFFLLPLRYIMHYTLPDVRDSENPSIGLAYRSTFVCLVWLVMGSYAMVSSLEALAVLMNVPDAVVGVTVSAAGTSLPNYIASRIAAEKGLGNQAVSNAFGSNIFNIMIGLGLPWVLYTSVGTGFEPYHDLRNDDILESIVILAAVLAVFVVLMVPTNFVMYRWHGAIFLVMYLGYINLVISQNWSWDTKLISKAFNKRIPATLVPVDGLT